MLAERAQVRKQRALDVARARGWPVRGTTPAGREFALMRLDAAGRPFYYMTDNLNAAISTAASEVRNIPPYNLSGAGLIVGVWDGGAIRTDHQEFASPARVTVMDGAALSDHATHVGGTVGARGIVAAAQGMAPSVLIHSYDWNDDLAEMTAAAAAEPDQPDRVYVSNHSYGYITGWARGDWAGVLNAWHWFGNWPDREDSGFGQYGETARDWDALCFAAPYFLPFKSIGNDRDDGMPGNGTVFYYLDNAWNWQPKAYNPDEDPFADQHKEGGFNTVSHHGTAKNILTVGAVNDAVSEGMRSLVNATMTSFSCWGPTDDGRIKPDLVANGAELYSSASFHVAGYGWKSGTSMSAPNAAGSALLLIEHYRALFPGRDMRAATLKGLLIHTADDLGRPGPDFEYGWGLINTRAAADHISAHAADPNAFFMIEDTLPQGETRTYVFLWDGATPIRATLSWTDPPGPMQTGLNSPTIVLVNDLDLRVTDPEATVHFPYILDANNYAAPATFGDNIRDNVEQAYIANPVAAGFYTVEVSHKNTLAGNAQDFSLLISGAAEMPEDFAISGYVRTADGVGIPQVTLSGLPGNPTTDENGHYRAMVAAGWSGTVTPYKPGHAFRPGSRSYADTTEDHDHQDYARAAHASATYADGHIPTDLDFVSLPGASGCPAVLTVTIPDQAEIVGVDVAYSMTAANGAWMAEQRSWLRCVSPGGTDEPVLTEGSGFAEGTYWYERAGLAIANGVSGGGAVAFELHAGRTWGGEGCGTTYNRVDDGSWTVTVHYHVPSSYEDDPPPDTTPPTIAITAPSSSSAWTSPSATATVAGTASDNVGVARVVVRNHRDMEEYEAAGTTNWSVENLPLHQGENYIDATAYDAAGNRATRTLRISYGGDTLYDSGLRSGQALQWLEFPDNVPRGHTVTVRWRILSYVPVRSYLQTLHRADDVTVWTVRRNGRFVGAEIGPWSIGGGAKHAYMYSFEAEWTAPDCGDAPADIFAWINVAQTDGLRYMMAAIPDGVDARPDPNIAKVFRRTILPAADPDSPGEPGSAFGDEDPFREENAARQFDTTENIKRRSGAAVTWIGVPDDWTPGAQIVCEWTALAYMDLEGQLALADFENGTIPLSVVATRTGSRQTGFSFTHGGQTDTAREYTFRASFTVPAAWADDPPGPPESPRIQVFFRHRIRNTSGARMAGNIEAGIDARAFEYHGMYGRFIERTVRAGNGEFAP